MFYGTLSKLAVFGALAGAVALTGCVIDDDYDDDDFDDDNVEITRTTTTQTYAPGYVTTTLPAGYVTRQYGGVDYYVADDVYYRRTPRGYTVVESPMGPAAVGTTTTVGTYSPGAVVRTLPTGYVARTYRGTNYYVVGNTWYRPHSRGYVIVNPPL